MSSKSHSNALQPNLLYRYDGYDCIRIFSTWINETEPMFLLRSFNQKEAMVRG